MSDLSIPVRRRDFLLVQAVTLARIPLAIAFAVTLPLFERTTALVVSCTVLLLAMELSDLLDGMLARRFGLVTEWGAMLDPYADSVSRLVVYWSLAAAGLALAVIPLVMAWRDVTVAYCRIIWTRRGRSVSAQWSGKIKAVVQAVCAILLLWGPWASGIVGPWWPAAVSWTVLLVTVASGADYIAKTVAALRRHEENPASADIR